MTPDERAEYERWKRDHQPTSTADRKRKRALRDQNAWARASVERHADAKPKTPELLEIEQRLAELRAELEQRRAFDEGVFG
ncbi:MAG: hypothetical protein JNK47_11105 [Mesorhizobium sp.]|nr:hypothetical protein [Mesorhizobium sp.]MBL8577767.1 hypothetical protein [Mesorhizobium sp.]